MSPEKDKVALVVQSGDLSSLELGNVREQCSEHPADGMTQAGIKVVQDQLWLV